MPEKTPFRPSLSIFCFVLAAFLLENIAFIALDMTADNNAKILQRSHQQPAKPVVAPQPVLTPVKG
jgi:hypothetical protein